MDKEIGSILPEQFTDKYFMYFGTEDIETLVENIEMLGLDKAKCFYIKLNNQFYAVFFESFDKEIIIGADKVFFTTNGRLNESTVGEAKIKYTINKRNIRWITDTLARELNYLYDGIEIYEYPNVNSKHYRTVESDLRLSNYVVLLALTFASKFYTLSDSDKMKAYFVHTDELMHFLSSTKGAISIDPFSQVIKFEDGSIDTYSYNRVLESNYYHNRTGNYYRYGNIGYKTIFALEHKNKYSTYTKREWPSMTIYNALYPDDDLFHSMPDYRKDKTTCKWCGKQLPPGKKSYCSPKCRVEYGRAVNVNRNALLPFLILCRDNFRCKHCNKDMALVNKYGIRIPTTKASDKPDKDNVYRSIAAVHHIIPVEEGGEDHQSNLESLCIDCHKKVHGKNMVEVNNYEATNKVISLSNYSKNKIPTDIEYSTTNSKTLFEELKLYRLNKSNQEGIRAYMIFKNTELDELVRLRPTTKEELSNVKGFGQNKIYKYGKDIINIIKMNT